LRGIEMTQTRVTIEEDEIDIIISALVSFKADVEDETILADLRKYIDKWVRVYEKYWKEV